MNKVFLSGVLTGVKVLNNSVKMAFARVTTVSEFNGTVYTPSFSVTLFKDLADKAAKLEGNTVVIEGYLKNSKYNKDGQDTFKLDVVASQLEACINVSEPSMPKSAPKQASSDEDIPF